MRSNAGMAIRQGKVDLRSAQVSSPQLELWLGLAWFGLAWLDLRRTHFNHGIPVATYNTLLHDF